MSRVNVRQSSTVDTLVSAPVGEQHKDRWARLFRQGDLEAGVYLSECYEAAGESAEALIVINEVLQHELGPELEARALLRKAAQQTDLGICGAAWKTINLARLDDVSPIARGKVHNQRGRILKELKKTDRAIIEYTAAAYYFELARSPELVGLASNNLASIYRKKKRYADAHESANKAIAVWANNEYLPHALDQKALVYIDEKRYREGYDLATKAVSLAGDHNRWKAEFLATLSSAQAGQGAFIDSMRSIDRALEICDYLNDANLRLSILVARKKSCEIMYQVSDKSSVKLALSLSGGGFRQAAKRLGMNHSAVTKAIKKHSL